MKTFKALVIGSLVSLSIMGLVFGATATAKKAHHKTAKKVVVSTETPKAVSTTTAAVK